MTRCIDVSVPVHDTVAQKFCLFQSWNHLKNMLLFRPLEPRLESNDIIDRPLRIVLPKLDDGVGALSRHWML